MKESEVKRMKKLLLLALIVCLFASTAVFAEDKEGGRPTNDPGGNVAIRYYQTTVDFGNNFDYSVNNIWLEGNAFFLKNRRLKGTVEWFGGSKSKTFNNIATDFDQNQFIGRVAYDVWEKTYVGIDYKSHKNDFTINGVGTGAGTFNGIGFGVDKEWKLGRDWDLHTNLHYYPTLGGPNVADFSNLEYEIGAVYRMPKFVNIDFGWRGEKWSGKGNASNTDVNINGPYLGVSKDF